MKNLAIILAIILMSSCVTQKKCNQKYPPQVITEIVEKETIRDSIVYRDRIVEIKIPADTVVVERVVEVPINLYIAPITAENDYARASAWVKDAKISLMLFQKEHTIREIIEAAEKETWYWKEKYEKEKIIEVHEVKFVPKFYKFSAGFLIISLIFGIIFVLVQAKSI